MKFGWLNLFTIDSKAKKRRWQKTHRVVKTRKKISHIRRAIWYFKDGTSTNICQIYFVKYRFSVYDEEVSKYIQREWNSL